MGFRKDLDTAAKPAKRRQGAGFRGISDTAKRFEAEQERLEKGSELCGGFVASRREREARPEYMVRLKAEFNRAQGEETADEHSGCEQEGEGEGDLQNNNGIAKTSAPRGTGETFAGVSHGVGQIAARDLNGRNKSRKKDGTNADDHREQKDGAVHFNHGLGGESELRHD